jgi:hypothetical protein
VEKRTDAISDKIWIYVAPDITSAMPTISRAFADPEAADEWFKANDPEGVAFEYGVIE